MLRVLQGHVRPVAALLGAEVLQTATWPCRWVLLTGGLPPACES